MMKSRRLKATNIHFDDIINKVIPPERGSPGFHPVFFFVSLFHGKKFGFFNLQKDANTPSSFSLCLLADWLPRNHTVTPLPYKNLDGQGVHTVPTENSFSILEV